MYMYLYIMYICICTFIHTTHSFAYTQYLCYLRRNKFRTDLYSLRRFNCVIIQEPNSGF